MKNYLAALFLPAVIPAIALAGAPDYIKAAAGHYEGTLTSHFNDTFDQRLVRADFSDNKDALKVLYIDDQSGTHLLTLSLSKLSKKDFVLAGSYLEGELQLKRNQDCFNDTKSDLVQVCFYRDGISIDVSGAGQKPLYSLTLGKFAVEKLLLNETPKTYDLATAIARAWKMNFNNRIEFEHVMQAKYGKTAAKMNLFPHFSFGTILNNIHSNITSILGAAGDLLPFLFPTRWLQAKQAGLQSEVEQDTMILLRLDTATQVEALFYKYDQDQQIKLEYASAFAKAKAVTDQVNIRVKIGDLRPQYYKDMLSLENFLEQDAQSMDLIVKEDLTCLSQAMGFYNPGAVSGAVLTSEILPINQAVKLDAEVLKKIALNRSIELRQVDFVIKQAKIAKTELAFNWLDPTGDPTMNLGLNLFSQRKSALSVIIEMQTRREKMQAELEHNVENAVAEFNQALALFPTTAFGVEDQISRMDLTLKTFKTTGKIDLQNYVGGLLQDTLNAQIRYEANIFAYRVARARVDRLVLTGYYKDGAKPVQFERK